MVDVRDKLEQNGFKEIFTGRIKDGWSLKLTMGLFANSENEKVIESYVEKARNVLGNIDGVEVKTSRGYTRYSSNSPIDKTVNVSVIVK